MPRALQPVCTSAKWERLAHSYGKSFNDIAPSYLRRFPNLPDIVAYPGGEADVAALLDWCDGNSYAAIPFGGGSNITGGVEPPHDPRFRCIVTIDISGLNQIAEVDRVSRAARIQGGAFVPEIEDLTSKITKEKRCGEGKEWLLRPEKEILVVGI